MANSRNNSSDSNSKSSTSDNQSPSSSPIQEAFQKVWNTVKKAADPRTERRFSLPGFLRRESSITPSTSLPRQTSSHQTSPVRTPPKANRPEDRRSSSSPKGRPQSRRTFSVPEYFRKYSPSSRRPPSPEQEVRPEDEEDSKFGNTLIGLLGRNKNSRYLLSPGTLKKIDKEIADEKIQKAEEGPRRNSIEVGVGAAEVANHRSGNQQGGH